MARSSYGQRLLTALFAVAVIRPGWALAIGPVLDLGSQIQIELVKIPKGTFTSGESHLNRSDIGFFSPYDQIAHPITISRDFFAGKFLVTVVEFGRFIEATNYMTDAESGRRPWRRLTQGAYSVNGSSWGPREDATWRNPGFPQDGKHPVTCISWYDAEAFCQWASKQSGRKVRLPSEVELEYLQRAGTKTRYFWGAHIDKGGRWANVADEGATGDEDIFLDGQPTMKYLTPDNRKDGYRYTSPVGSFVPNLFDVYDAIGNVWEYTSDWNGPERQSRSMKGGSWMSSPDFYRPSLRMPIEPESRTSTRGMRIVVEE